jgi:hypothetical protein
MSSDEEIIRLKVPAKHAHTFLMFLLKEKRSEISSISKKSNQKKGSVTMSSTMQVLEFWRWKRMEIEAEIAKHPEREDLHIWRSQITVRIEQLQKQIRKEEAEKHA